MSVKIVSENSDLLDSTSCFFRGKQSLFGVSVEIWQRSTAFQQSLHIMPLPPSAFIVTKDESGNHAGPFRVRDNDSQQFFVEYYSIPVFSALEFEMREEFFPKCETFHALLCEVEHGGEKSCFVLIHSDNNVAVFPTFRIEFFAKCTRARQNFRVLK